MMYDENVSVNVLNTKVAGGKAKAAGAKGKSIEEM